MKKNNDNLINHLSKTEIDEISSAEYESREECEKWVTGFLSIGFDEWIDMVKPKYSEMDIEQAIEYAFICITINPGEVGKDVYDILIREKINEYLTLLSENK